VSGHVHDYRITFTEVGGQLVLERKLTAQPLYPWQCRCGHLVWLSGREAVARGIGRFVAVEARRCV
jgi:hypothetical protein